MAKLTNFRIVVKTLQGEIIAFYVDQYAIIEGDFVSFFDEKSQQYKRFHAIHCEIYNEDGE